MTDAAPRAVAHARSRAARDAASAGERAGAILERAGVSAAVADLARAAATRPVTVHFHPDRIVRDGPHAGRLTVEGMAATGTFENQFATGTSSGSVDSGRDGRRIAWEDRLFGDAYSATVVTDRVRYGALNLLDHPDGASIGFGSCHLVLAPIVADRLTFTLGDSHGEPDVAGTVDTFGSVVAGLLEESERSGTVLGVDMPVAELTRGLLAERTGSWGGVIDTYVEAQIHGGIDLRTDVEAIVGDPAFRHGPIGDHLAALARLSGATLRWHPGTVLPVGHFPGQITLHGVTEDLTLQRDLARGVAAACTDDGVLDAAAIGAAARSAVNDPLRWQRWGRTGDVLQLCKQVWKVVVLAGRRP